VREGSLTPAQGRELIRSVPDHAESDFWNLVPVTDALLRTAATLIRGLPRMAPSRAGNAIHLATVLEVGQPKMWTNHRHLLAAAPHIGIAGRSVVVTEIHLSRFALPFRVSDRRTQWKEHS